MLVVTDMAAIDSHRLGETVTSLEAHHGRIVTAIARLLQGF